MGSGSEPPKKGSLLDLDEPADELPEEDVPTVIPPMRGPSMTITDEHATEQARLASVLMESAPPPPDPSQAIRARLAPMSRVPALARSIAELGPIVAEPRVAYVLGFVDGVLPLETIVEVTGLPELETLEIVERLVEGGAIIFPPPRAAPG